MKMLKYILIASIFTMTSLVGYSASEATTTPTATEQKGLTEEELYQKQQAELDKQMVEKVDEIRGRLKKFVREVRKVSPATADLLLKEYFGIKVIQYLISLFILGIVFSITKYVINFIVSI